MYLSNEQLKLYCLECVTNVDESVESEIFPLLEELVKQHSMVNVYKAVDTIEDFEESLNTLLYEDRNFKDYDLLYFICSGTENEIIVNDYLHTLEEIAELFEGKLKGKILHFANSKTLNIDRETAQYFLDVTGAKAISGYEKPHIANSMLLDYHFFSLYPNYDHPTEIVEALFDKHYALCTNLGFHMYY